MPTHPPALIHFKTLLTTVVLGLALSACQTTRYQDGDDISGDTPALESEPGPRTRAPKPKPKPERRITDAELRRLDRELGLTAGGYGFREKSYNPCTRNPPLKGLKCGTRYFSRLQFKMMCRDTTGTVQTTASGFSNYSNRSFKWRVGLFYGTGRTNAQGIATVRLSTPGTSRNQRLVLRAGKHSLRQRARDVSRIVIPADWCY